MVVCSYFHILLNLSFDSHAETFEDKLQLAKTALSNEVLDNAEEYIQLAVKNIDKETDNRLAAEVYYWLGVIMENQGETSSIFSVVGYGKSSLKGYLKSVELEPKNILYRKSLINFYLGAPGIAGGDFDLAIKHAKVIFEQDPNRLLYKR